MHKHHISINIISMHKLNIITFLTGIFKYKSKNPKRNAEKNSCLGVYNHTKKKNLSGLFFFFSFGKNDATVT